MNKLKSTILLVGFLFIIGTPSLHAASYEIIDLGGLNPYCINNNGEIVGEITGTGQGFIWDSQNLMRSYADLGWQDYSYYYINNLSQVPTVNFATCINDLGEMAGHDTFWNSDGTTVDLGDLGGGGTFAYDINNSGQVAGVSSTQDNVNHAFIWDEQSGIQDLDPNAILFSSASGINEAGDAVGSTFFNGVGLHAALWNSQIGIQDLGSLGESYSSHASEINNYGQVVGDSFGIDFSHGFLWDDNSGMRDLNDLIPFDSGWVVEWGSSINDLGQIVGTGSLNGERHGFLMMPESHVVPEPSSLFLLGSAIFGAGIFRRKRIV